MKTSDGDYSMNIFKFLFKKKPKKTSQCVPDCQHEWEELPWYLETDESYECAGCLIDISYYHALTATYVCRKCGKVKRKLLSSGWTDSSNSHCDAIDQIKLHAGDKLKPKFVVESMIESISLKG